MKFERRLITGNEVLLRAEEEIKPKGVLIYSSGFPVTRDFMRRTMDRATYRASVHALIAEDGVTQLVPLDVKANHGMRKTANDRYLAVMVCEPTGSGDYSASRELIKRNLVQYLVFLCRYWAIEPVNVCDLIQFAGTASENQIVAPESIKSYGVFKAYFGRPAKAASEGDDEYVDETLLKTEVKQTLGQLATLYRETIRSVETPLSQIGIGDVVLFTGGDLFSTRGISTRMNFEPCMRHGVVTNHSDGSRHAYEVTFPKGPVNPDGSFERETVWVNKGTLTRSTLGHVSL